MDMRLSKMQVITGLVGVMIVGEALALLVGLGWLSRWQSPWLSWKNLTLLVLDLIAGTLST